MNGYYIWQDPEAFCFGIDAVLLAHYPAIRPGDQILDLGCGFGPIPLILHAEARDRGYVSTPERLQAELPVEQSELQETKMQMSPRQSQVQQQAKPHAEQDSLHKAQTPARPTFHITGLELQPSIAETARRSVEENGLSSDISIITGDIRKAAELFRPDSFSLITCNPPYMPAGQGFLSDDETKAIARTEVACTLRDIVEAAAHLLKMSGRFALIHRPFRLPEIFCLLKEYRLEPKRMRLVCPTAGAEPTMVLIEAVRGARPNLKIAPPLIVYGDDHEYTEEIKRIYGRDTLSGGDTDRQS